MADPVDFEARWSRLLLLVVDFCLGETACGVVLADLVVDFADDF
jgi:hypothetical protein